MSIYLKKGDAVIHLKQKKAHEAVTEALPPVCSTLPQPAAESQEARTPAHVLHGVPLAGRMVMALHKAGEYPDLVAEAIQDHYLALDEIHPGGFSGEDFLDFLAVQGVTLSLGTVQQYLEWEVEA